jgi:predicted tellurium resistance membrane protein TerC
MEIVLGIDNIVFIAIVTGRLPEDQQPSARRLGLAAAMIMRILLLLSITWILQLDEPLFLLTDFGVPESWFEGAEHAADINAISVKDLILFVGGLFLIANSVHEIHQQIEGEEDEHQLTSNMTFQKALFQIAVMDIIFSLDSVITAVGMAERVNVMIAAVVIAVGVMMVFAGPVSRFVENNPTLRMLALSFLILIGVMLIADGVGTHIDKGYVYFAMAFSIFVEFLNLRARSKNTRAE